MRIDPVKHCVWTSVDDKHPECAGWYLVALKDGTVTTSYFEWSKCGDSNQPHWLRVKNDKVTHWMCYPLHPFLPKKEQEVV